MVPLRIGQRIVSSKQVYYMQIGKSVSHLGTIEDDDPYLRREVVRGAAVQELLGGDDAAGSERCEGH